MNVYSYSAIYADLKPIGCAMRICKECKIEKHLDEFYRRSNGTTSHCCCKACYLVKYSPNRGKPNLGRFKSGLTPWNRKEIDGRYSRKAKSWRIAILDRDGHVCKLCNKRKKRMHAHHIKDWYNFPELRFDLSNGQTLCMSCHAIIHGKEKCNFLKNGTSWCKGMKMSKEHCEKLSKAHKRVSGDIA